MTTTIDVRQIVSVCGDQQPMTGRAMPFLCSLRAGHDGPHRAVRDDGTDYASWAEPPTRTVRPMEQHVSFARHTLLCAQMQADPGSDVEALAKTAVAAVEDLLDEVRS